MIALDIYWGIAVGLIAIRGKAVADDFDLRRQAEVRS